MRQCYEDVTNNNIESVAAHIDFLNDKFDEEKLYAQFVDSVKSVTGEPVAQEAGNVAPAQLVEPGGLMSLDRIDGLFTGSE